MISGVPVFVYVIVGSRAGEETGWGIAGDATRSTARGAGLDLAASVLTGVSVFATRDSELVGLADRFSFTFVDAGVCEG